MQQGELCIFALGPDRRLGEQIAHVLGMPLADHEERDFEDGEHKIRPLQSVRGQDVFVVQSLYDGETQSINDKLCRLLFFIGALKDASAARVTAVLPYLCYARKDRKTQPWDPVTTRYVAAMFEAVGVDRVVTMDVHNLAAFQNAYRCRTDHLEAKPLFVYWFAPRLKGREVVVVSPDAGGVKRAHGFRDALSTALKREISTAFMEKQRREDAVTGNTLVGEVEGRTAIIIDDLISTGTTLARAAAACRQQGATQVFAAATHGLFVSDADHLLAGESLDCLLISDTIPPFRLRQELLDSKVVIVETAKFFAAAIERMHSGGSVEELMEV